MLRPLMTTHRRERPAEECDAELQASLERLDVQHVKIQVGDEDENALAVVISQYPV